MKPGNHSVVVRLSSVTALILAGCVMSCGKQPERPEPRDLLDKRLIEAVAANRLTEVENLLERGANPNVVPKEVGVMDGGWSPLLIAARLNHVQVARALIVAGADVNLRVGDDPSGTTPLMAAAANNGLEMVELLLRRGANVNARAGIQPSWPTTLGYTVDEGHLACVEALLRESAAIDRRDLQAAIFKGHLKIARQLLESGADARWSFYDGSTHLRRRNVRRPRCGLRW